MKKQFNSNTGPSKSSYTTGARAGAEEFRSAVLALAGEGFDYFHASPKESRAKEAFDKKIAGFQKGALEAFREDRPENIQIALGDAEVTKIMARGLRHRDNTAQYILNTLFEVKGAAALALVKMPADKKQKFLDHALLDVMRSSSLGNDARDIIVPALIEAGARVDAFAGLTLSWAVERSCSDKVIDLFHEKRASFDAALWLMETGKWQQKTINRLKEHQTRIAAPKTAAAKNRPQP